MATEYSFTEWFKATDLGEFEPVRELMEMAAVENIADIAEADDPWAVARSTVEMWLDDKASARAIFCEALARASR